MAQLKDVDVEYILNLVNFHSVDFSGKASGKAIVKSIFNDPDAYAKLDIKDFDLRKRTDGNTPCQRKLQQGTESDRHQRRGR